jgi:hypothetical protein
MLDIAISQIIPAWIGLFFYQKIKSRLSVNERDIS